ncbi:MAG: hypothetical protein IPJ76_00490 [Flavobacteriales bacterium]|nr:MAG: hypothetical protein IPJ76_00490 [Flavobacteriales bacterium]
MRILLLSLWSVFSIGLHAAQAESDLLTDLRTNVRAVFEDEAVLQRLQARVAGADASADPLLSGYKGILLMAEGKHRSNPFSRFGPFNEGKALLDGAIVAAPASVELRFLRLSVQTNVPGILRYGANKAEDRAFIEAHLYEVKNEQLRRRIIDFIARAAVEGRL